MKPFITEKTRRYFFMGIFYGYPTCCINDFASRKDASTITKEQEEVQQNEGFIPCHKCAKKVLNSGLTIESLITDRFCKTEYPKDIVYALEDYLVDVK